MNVQWIGGLEIPSPLWIFVRARVVVVVVRFALYNFLFIWAQFSNFKLFSVHPTSLLERD